MLGTVEKTNMYNVFRRRQGCHLLILAEHYSLTFHSPFNPLLKLLI